MKQYSFRIHSKKDFRCIACGRWLGEFILNNHGDLKGKYKGKDYCSECHMDYRHFNNIREPELACINGRAGYSFGLDCFTITAKDAFEEQQLMQKLRENKKVL